MNSILLKIAFRTVAILLVALSLVVLYRGHNLPGGGFIGGLLAASAVVLRALTSNMEDAENWMPASPISLLVGGLLITVLSGLPAMLAGYPFMTGMWLPALDVVLLGKVKLGTPLLFDVGVFLTVIGFTTKCALALGDNIASWKS